jgi:Zn-finger nucleic acid-binding protein
MAFGKAVGWGATAAVSGVLLVTTGLGTTALFAAIVSAVVLVGFACVRERDGERRLPWSAGAAVIEMREGSIGTLFRGLGAVLMTRASLVLIAVMFLDGLTGGYGHALMPIAAIKLFGFTTPEWSQLVAAMGLAGAAAALGLGPLIDRFGAKRMLLVTTVLVAVHALLLAQTQYLWEDTMYVRVMLSVWILLGPVTMVCMIALAMALCSNASSATQFAVYMSVANLGAAVGAGVYGMVAEGLTYQYSYLLLGVLTLVMIGVLMTYRHRHKDGDSRGARPLGLGVGAGSAGTFWSGAMRCPKCRCDMDPVVYDDVEVDRCSSCQGLWFDAGEVGKLRNRKAARAIDVGNVRTGRTHNSTDRYPCPRCGGPMVRMVDAAQSHIWYEKCRACHGSYFDAGEFSDLATKSIGDVFRRMRTPERT